MSDTQKRLYLRCACGSEMLVVEAEYDADYTIENPPEFNLAIFKHGHAYPMTWKERFRAFWHILIHGHMYYDEIMLNKFQTLDLVEFLIKSCARSENKK